MFALLFLSIVCFAAKETLWLFSGVHNQYNFCVISTLGLGEG